MTTALKTPTTLRLGAHQQINRVGFGAMRLTGQPGNFGPYPDWEAGVHLVRRAAALGVNFFDSAWAYGPQSADQLLGEALEGEDVVIATKGGVDKPAPGRIVMDGSPARLREQILTARDNLRRDRIDLFQLHRVDPDVRLETSVEALAQAVEDGLISHIGLSNVSIPQLERALKVAPIATVQNRYNSAERADDPMVAFTGERGIIYIPYGPLGAKPMEQGAALSPVPALTWLLRRAPHILTIPGTTSVSHLAENISAAHYV